MQSGALYATYYAVWGTGGDVFAISATMIQHRNDATWSLFSVPGTGSGDTLAGIWGTSATDFFVVGNSGSTAGVIYHYALLNRFVWVGVIIFGGLISVSPRSSFLHKKSGEYRSCRSMA